MPGVLIIEAMAQTAAVLVVHTLGPGAEGKLVYFMSIDNARFRRPVVPGDLLACPGRASSATAAMSGNSKGRRMVDGKRHGGSDLRRHDRGQLSSERWRKFIRRRSSQPGARLGATCRHRALLPCRRARSSSATGSSSCRMSSVAGRTAIGERTRIFPFASIGHQPQDLKYHGEPIAARHRRATTSSANTSR